MTKKKKHKKLIMKVKLFINHVNTAVGKL